jgi:hypothetical protein
MRLYTLYPTIDGYSNKTIDYNGVELSIAAESIKRAFYFAYNDVWAEGPENPSGNHRAVHPERTPAGLAPALVQLSASRWNRP